MTPAEQLLALVRDAYAALLDALPPDRGHCYEVSAIARVVAIAMGLEASLCRGHRVRYTPDRTHDFHGWLELQDGRILHSPERGVVEPVSADPKQFVTAWQAGP